MATGPWVKATAGVLATLAGGEQFTSATAFAGEPPAKTTKDNSPDAKLRASMETLTDSLGHRTPGSKEANKAIAEMEDTKLQEVFKKSLNETIPDLIRDLKDGDKRKAANEKLRAEFKLFIDALGAEEFRTREAATMALDDVSHYADVQLVEAIEKNKDPKEKNRDTELWKRAEMTREWNRRSSPAETKKILAALDLFDGHGPMIGKAMPLLMEAFWKKPIDADRNDDIYSDRQIKQKVMTLLAKAKATPELVSFLQNDDLRYVRDITLETMANMGPEANGATPALKKLLLKEHDIEVGRVLAKTRADVKNVPELRKELKSKDVWERVIASLALKEVAPKIKLQDKETRSGLLLDFSHCVQSDTDSEVRINAAIGLGSMYSNTISKEERTIFKEKVVPALIEGLKHFNADVQEPSALALKEIGADAAAALDDLQQKMKSTSFASVSTACELAITTINDALKKGPPR